MLKPGNVMNALVVYYAQATSKPANVMMQHTLTAATYVESYVPTFSE
jgi:hypothetical protein